jgi:hypothetical protein
MFENLKVTRVNFELKSNDEFLIKPFITSTFRGGVGYMLKKICCAQRLRSECLGCMLFNTCAYSYFYEPEFKVNPAADSVPIGFEKGLLNSPRPYRIGFPKILTQKGLYLHAYEKSQTIKLPITFIGNASDRINYFILAVMELGKTGLGKNKIRFDVDKIIVNGPDSNHTIYNSTQARILNFSNLPEKSHFSVFENFYFNLLKDSGGRFEIKFITPLRLREKKSPVYRPEYKQLLKSILTRSWALYYLYQGINEKIDAREYIDRADNIIIENTSLKWNSMKRYSTRQNREMDLQGLTGKITYKIDNTGHESLDIYKKTAEQLALMKLLGLGKSSVFGFGEVDIIKASENKTAADNTSAEDNVHTKTAAAN